MARLMVGSKTLLACLALLLVSQLLAFQPSYAQELEQRLVADSSRKQAAISLTVNERQTMAQEFKERYGPWSQGVVEFINWLVNSKRITDDGDDSLWWRGVDGLMVLDMKEAQDAIDNKVYKASTKPVQDWLNFANYTTKGFTKRPPSLPLAALDLKAQSLWWLAHQRSLHASLRAFSAELPSEPATEVRLIEEVVVPNVDVVALAKGPTTVGAIKVYTGIFYPKVYPTDSHQLAVALLSSPGRLSGLGPDKIGVNATTWD